MSGSNPNPQPDPADVQKQDADTETELEVLKVFFEQNWLHARHIENERLWFTNVYVVLIVALMAILGTSNISPTSGTLFPLYSIIAYFSFLGLGFCMKIRIEFHNHTTKAEQNVRRMAELAQCSPDMGISQMGLPINTSIWRYVKVRNVMVAFYLPGLIFGIILSIITFSPWLASFIP